MLVFVIIFAEHAALPGMDPSRIMRYWTLGWMRRKKQTRKQHEDDQNAITELTSPRISSPRLSGQFHAHAVEAAAASILARAPADSAQTQAPAELASLTDIGREQDLDGIAGGQGIVHLEHETGSAVIDGAGRNLTLP
jgi:hypothetical protein